MSKTQEAKDLLAYALDEVRVPKDRLKALEDANVLRRELSIGWAKLGAPEGFNMAATIEDLRELIAKPVEPAQEPQAEGDKETPLESEPTPPKKDRGGIGRLVNELLVDTDLDYKAIVEKVKENFPDAKTTARSVASVAADLRRDGVDVKARRKPAAPKAVKA